MTDLTLDVVYDVKPPVDYTSSSTSTEPAEEVSIPASLELQIDSPELTENTPTQGYTPASVESTTSDTANKNNSNTNPQPKTAKRILFNDEPNETKKIQNEVTTRAGRK